MKIELESTDEMAVCNGAPCRVWQGTTSKGTRVRCYIALMEVPLSEDQSEFVAEFASADVEAPDDRSAN